MKIHFILVEPQVPENIGAAARAIKTMGFDSLRLVRPGGHLSENARRMAYASIEILENAGLYKDLAASVEDIDFVIGATCRVRSKRHDYYTGAELYEIIKNKKSAISNAAIVFGNEKKGLSNSDLECCDIFSTIRMNNLYPSLNLAQAVMVYAYAMSGLTLENKSGKSPAEKDRNQLEALKNKTGKILNCLGYAEEDGIYTRTMERLGALSLSDIKLIHNFCGDLIEKL